MAGRRGSLDETNAGLHVTHLTGRLEAHHKQLLNDISQLNQLINNSFAARDDKIATSFKHLTDLLEFYLPREVTNIRLGNYEHLQDNILLLQQLVREKLSSREEAIARMSDQLQTRQKHLQRNVTQLDAHVNNFEARDNKMTGLVKQLTDHLQERHDNYEQLQKNVTELTQLVKTKFVAQTKKNDNMLKLLTDQLEDIRRSSTGPAAVPALPEADRRDVHAILRGIDKMMADFQLKMMHNDMETGSQLMIRCLQDQLDNRAEELREFKFVVETTIERELREHLGTRAAKQGRRASEEHVKILKKLFDELKQAFDAKIVAGWMYQQVALTLTETEQIQASPTQCDAAEKLLNILLTEPRQIFLYFLDALRRTNQEHVYKRIMCPDDTVKSEHGKLIRNRYVFLVDYMDARTSLLTAHLYDADVLSLREKEDINAELTSTRQNEKLLSVLSRKSAEHWGLFLTALDNTGQSHIRKYITGHTDLELEQQRVKELEKIVAEMEEMNKRLSKEIRANKDTTVAGEFAKLTMDHGDEKAMAATGEGEH